MPTYKIEWDPAARRDFRKLSIEIRTRIVSHISDLATTPRPDGVRKIVGAIHTYRIRVGDYRVIYRIVDEELQILVIRVGHRREIYQ